MAIPVLQSQRSRPPYPTPPGTASKHRSQGSRKVMNLPPEDQKLLEELCQQHGLSTVKVLQLLKTVREYEFKDRRTGVYNALKDILCTDYPTSAENPES